MGNDTRTKNKFLNYEKKLTTFNCFCCILFVYISLHAQSRENIWFDGLSRSYFARDAVDNGTIDDTISARNTSNGYNLLDLNTHVNPIDDIEIFAQLRIRNSFGGFFGSGTETVSYTHLTLPTNQCV